MAQLIFNVDHQTITRLDDFKVVASSINYLYAQFTFTDDWGTGTKTAQFKVSDGETTVARSQILDADGTCLVPWEVLQYENVQLEVSVFAGTRITANKAIVIVHEDGYLGEEGHSEPTPDVYEQIIEKLDEIDQKVTDKDVLAESWAIGGTGIREGEDTDNAKYYAEQAHADAEEVSIAADEVAENARAVDTAAKSIIGAEKYVEDKEEAVSLMYEEIKDDYESVQRSEGQAKSYAETAESEARTATNAKAEVQGYAEAARQNATNASQSASDALESARLASSFSTRASGFATNAQSYASDANRSAQSASSSATDASDFATEAQQYSEDASQSATDASNSATAATNAKTDAVAAKTAAETAITHYPKIENDTWWVWNVSTETWVDTGVKAQGEKGNPGNPGTSPTVNIVPITGGHRITITDSSGSHIFDVMDGEDGVTPTVDDAMSDTSTNPVQNKVIDRELTDVKDKLNELPIEETGAELVKEEELRTLYEGAFLDTLDRIFTNLPQNEMMGEIVSELETENSWLDQLYREVAASMA